jgi:SAM-dependent methyltransferase
MKVDIRTEAAKYYDCNPNVPNDIPFYINHIPSQQTTVLELGCGTGRVTLALVQHCRYIHGIDLSESMISICQGKLMEANIPPSKAKVEVGDITDFDLEQTFDLVIAPFRVLQNLESNSEVDGLFRCVRKHLAPGGTCILNVFNPNRDRESLRREWCTDEERLCWEVPIEGGKIACYDRKPRMNMEKLILYPELIYRRYEGEVLRDETVLKLIMRCYYPDDFEKLVTAHGFNIIDRWGGYMGEAYGKGPELVIQFAEGS